MLRQGAQAGEFWRQSLHLEQVGPHLLGEEPLSQAWTVPAVYPGQGSLLPETTVFLQVSCPPPTPPALPLLGLVGVASWTLWSHHVPGEEEG